MAPTNDFLAEPNRPDAIGVFDDSPAADPAGPYSRTRYAGAMKRLVQRLMGRVEVVRGDYNRGKRRDKTRPQDRSNTIRTYLKALEIWTFYCVAKYGRELEPIEITTDKAAAFAGWLTGELEGPDIRPYYIQSLGREYEALYDAMRRVCAVYGEANITRIVEALDESTRNKIFDINSDARITKGYELVHTMLGNIVRMQRDIVRKPTAADIRREEGYISSARERDPNTYTYLIPPRSRLKLSSVATYLAGISALWSEMAKPSAPGEQPILFNPWQSICADVQWRAKKDKRNIEEMRVKNWITHPLLNAMMATTQGIELEDRRNRLLLCLLTYLGLRCEEVTGLLRRDLREIDGILNLAVVGKGSKIRLLPVYGIIRDAYTMLNAALEEGAGQTAVTEDGEVKPTYEGEYCRALMMADAPLVPSLMRWGCNKRESGAGIDAMEPMDTSGIRAIISKLADLARVKVVATGEVRGLTKAEKSRIHPHAFRHYAATGASHAGVPLQEIKAILGHSKIETTEGYIQVSAQQSMAFSAGIYRMQTSRVPLTPEELATLRPDKSNPLEEPEIVAAEAGVAQRDGVRSTFSPMAEPDGERVVESPSWAYETPDHLKAFLPIIPPQQFSLDVKRKVNAAQRELDRATSDNNQALVLRATDKLVSAQIRNVWNQFGVGMLSRLPWWRGPSNQWHGAQMAPIMSYAQMAPENGADAYVIEALKALHEKFMRERGPGAAAALVGWISQLVSRISAQFSADMAEKEHTWIPFSAASPASAKVVREHRPDAIVQWLDRFGGVLVMSGYRTTHNAGNPAIAALDTLPDWVWSPDPLLDLPAEDRAELRRWIEGMQGTRQSQIRFDQWVEQMTVRLSTWASKSDTFRHQTGKMWSEDSAAASESGLELQAEAGLIVAEFKERFPSIRKRIDVPSLVSGLDPRTDENISKRIIAGLSAAGIQAAKVQGMNTSPAISGTVDRPGIAHMLDPAVLTFNSANTIVHDEATQQYWYGRFGGASQATVRRALRSLWERRKKSLRAPSKIDVLRQFDLWLFSILPDPATMESRMRKQGWKLGRSVDQTIDASKVLWLGLCDHARALEGALPVEKIPNTAIEPFWEKEIPEINQFVIEHSPRVVVVVEGSAEADDSLKELSGEQEPKHRRYIKPMSPEHEAALDLALVQTKESLDDVKEAVDEAVEEATTFEAVKNLGKGAEKEDLGWRLDPDRFNQALQIPAQYLAIGDESGSAIFTVKFLRRVSSALAARSPSIWWDSENRTLRFRWQNRRGGLNLKPMDPSMVPRRQPIAEAWIPGRISAVANQPMLTWTDKSDRAPRWPGYPQVIGEDFSQPFIQAWGWPTEHDAPLEALCRFQSCMDDYASWKRASAKASRNYIPNRWTPSPNAFEQAIGPAPNPVEVEFALIRSA